MLSVTLFLVAINDILNKLGNRVDGSLFADDLAIYATIRNIRVQTTTNKLEKWVTEKGLKFSPNKTTMMIFRKREEEPLDSRLNWEEHIEKTKAKAKRALNIIKNSSRKEMGSRQKDPKKLYSAICRSKIDYGCQLYGTATKSRLKHWTAYVEKE